MPIIIISRLYKTLIIQGRSQEFTERPLFLVPQKVCLTKNHGMAV